MFVYIQKELNINGVKLRKYEVGIEKGREGNRSLVEFAALSDAVQIVSEDLQVFEPSETGDAFEKKICNRCNRLLPIAMFTKNQNGKNNRSVRRPSCNDCRRLIDGTAVSAKDKREWEKTKPENIFWVCPICKKKTIPGLTSKVVLDHDHQTGKPNEWICDSCNTGLGRFNDDISVMEEAIHYLKKHKK